MLSGFLKCAVGRRGTVAEKFLGRFSFGAQFRGDQAQRSYSGLASLDCACQAERTRGARGGQQAHNSRKLTLGMSTIRMS